MTDNGDTHKPAAKDAIKPQLADDILRGAAEIAAFLYGKREQRRTIYHLAANTRAPFFRIGTQLHARKSVLEKWITDQERRGLPINEVDPDHR